MSDFVVRRERLPHGSHSFFAPLKSLDRNDLEHVIFAYRMSEAGHYRQGKRDSGEPYFTHPKGAAEIYINELGGRDPRAIIGLLLHDIQEDVNFLTYHRIARNFGDEVAYDVQALTKWPQGKETTKEYLLRVIAGGPWTTLDKLCDRLHNLRTLEACSNEKQAAQIAETVEYHLPILIPALREHGGIWAEHADKLEQLILQAIHNHSQREVQKSATTS